MVYDFCDKISSSATTSRGAIKSKIMSNQCPSDLATRPLAEQLQPFIRKFEKRKVYSFFKDNIWDADLLGMQLIGKYNKGIRLLLCVIDIYNKCA